MFHEVILIEDGFIFSWTKVRAGVEISREFNIHVFCLFASSVFSRVVSRAYRHFPDKTRNASSCVSLLPASEIAQDWWDGLSPTIFFQALFCSLVFNQCVRGLKESQKFSRESLFLCRHSFWFILLWCPCTDFTLTWIFSVTFSSSAWSLRRAETSLKGVNERNPLVLKMDQISACMV